MKKIIFVLLIMINCVLFMPLNNVEVNGKTNDGYYYNQLNDNSKKFYHAFEQMEELGIFKSNQKYDLIANNIINNNDIKTLLTNNQSILKDFAAAKDAYYLEHPQIFYVDFSKMQLSIKQQNNHYIAQIDAGRNNSYLYDGIDLQIIELMITQFQEKLNIIIDELKTINDDFLTIKFINSLICERTTYSFEADGTTIMKNQIRTAYGALMNAYAVCEGYARAFKTIVDFTNIPCEIINGFYHDGENVEPHAWCYVKLNNKWYLVDPTFNDNEFKPNQYLLIGKNNSLLYEEDGCISNSGFEFKYPSLATYDYGTEAITTSVAYDTSTNVSHQIINYKYNDYYNASNLLKDGYYLIVRNEYYDDYANSFKWGAFYNMYDIKEDYIIMNHGVFSSEIAITTQKPDIIDSSYGFYNNLDETQIIAKSDVIYNEVYNDVANTPKVSSTTPSATSVLDANETYHITIQYNALIKLADAEKKVGIYVYNEKSKNLNEYVKCENIFLNEDSITFDFTPSKMYEHDSLTYKFVLLNVVGNNGYAPQCASFVFARPWQVCSKIFNDERLYINAYATPTIIDAKDLSMDNFTIDGKHISENQRSQLSLVATKPSKKDIEVMNNKVEELLVGDNLSSSTYNLDLHICGGVRQIPSGSYVKVAFGFPEGYGPNDAGVTFKVYHFKRNSLGEIDPSLTEEVECVVTEYGIVITVDSFSPFMVVATNEEKKDKTIYARVVSGEGEIIINVDNKIYDKKIVSTINEEIMYEFKANSNYSIDYVLLNKKELEVIDNKVIIKSEELNLNNELIVSFASNDVLKEEQNNNIISLNKNIISFSKVNNNSIIGYVLVAIAIVGCISLVAIIIKKRK